MIIVNWEEVGIRDAPRLKHVIIVKKEEVGNRYAPRLTRDFC